MRTTVILLAALTVAGRGVPISAQSSLPNLTGTWEADTPEGPQRLVVGSDSIVRLGTDSVQWRQTPDSVFLLLGGEWVGYRYVLREPTLTLSGGDLLDPLVLRRVAQLPPGSTRLTELDFATAGRGRRK
jgi:hypothetical protein